MQCDHCGAPLEIVRGRDLLHCHYCGAFHFSSDPESSADGVTRLGPQRDLACPVCDIHLDHGAAEGAPVHYCQKCRGLLVTNDDFAHIVRVRRAIQEGHTDAPIPLDPQEFKRSTRCPNCQRTMDTHPYYGPGAVVIDSCNGCRLVWLDHGEIAAIQSAPGRR